MAGDLYIENISFDEFRVLEDSGAVIDRNIFHADKSWHRYQHVLRERLPLGAPSNRVNLPAHAYVRFEGVNRQALATYMGDRINRARLNNLLDKCTRPLRVVSAHPRLNNWGRRGENHADMLLEAVNLGNVTLEYYKYDGSPVLFVQTGWTKHNE